MISWRRTPPGSDASNPSYVKVRAEYNTDFLGEEAVVLQGGNTASKTIAMGRSGKIVHIWSTNTAAEFLCVVGTPRRMISMPMLKVDSSASAIRGRVTERAQEAHATSNPDSNSEQIPRTCQGLH